MKFSIENGFFIPSPSLAAEKHGPGLNISSENEHFKREWFFRAWGNAQRALRSKSFNPDRKFQSRSKISISLENFKPGPSQFPTKNRGLAGGALENFNPA